MASWARIVHTTITDYMRREEPAMMRNRKVPAMLDSMGRTTMNCSGKDFQWEVRYKRIEMDPYGDMDQVTRSRKDVHLNAVLDYRGYNITDTVSKMEILANRSTEALVKIFEPKGKRLMEDIKDDFANEFYIDGNASGNEKRIHGIESFMSNTGSVVTSSFARAPNDTYAGLVCTLGNYGGAVTTIWPIHPADNQYDFWSPVIVDSTTTYYGSGTIAFSTHAVSVLRSLILAVQRNSGQDSQPDVIILSQTDYFKFLEALDDKERIAVQADAKSSRLVSLGFSDVVRLDGTDITWEYSIPASTIGYAWNFKKMELRSMQGQMFNLCPIDEDANRKTYNIDVDFFGNLLFDSPRYFGKIV